MYFLNEDLMYLFLSFPYLSLLEFLLGFHIKDKVVHVTSSWFNIVIQ